MFQFPACPPLRLWIHLRVTVSSTAGFPHSDINGSMPACRSPLLFAACHVLLRRMVPGHPPCALCSLIFSSIPRAVRVTCDCKSAVRARYNLDPETNCFSVSSSLSAFQSVLLFQSLLRSLLITQLQSATGLFMNLFSFAVQLSRCGLTEP